MRKENVNQGQKQRKEWLCTLKIENKREKGGGERTVVVKKERKHNHIQEWLRLKQHSIIIMVIGMMFPGPRPLNTHTPTKK